MPQDVGMRRLLLILFAVGWVIALATAGASAQTGTGERFGTADLSTVHSLRFGDHGTMWRVVIDLSQPVRFQASVLSDPYRVVIDLPPVDWRARQSGHFQAQGLLDGYQYLAGGAAGGGRLTVNLRGPARIKEMQALEPRGGAGHRLVVDLEPIAAGAFRSTGTLPQASRSELAPAPAPKPVEQAATPTVQPLASPTSSHRIPEPRAPEPATEARAAPIPPLLPPGRRDPGRPVIVIDPGHGGADPGTLGAQGTLEKSITLLFSRELKRQIEATGRYSVFLTRSGDTFQRLRDRVEFARRSKADLFISVHADSLQDSSVRGASVYTLSDQASDAEAGALAAKENKADVIAGVDLTNENPVVASILIDLAQRETMNLSATFARHLVEEMAEPARILRKTHRFAGFAVLKAPDVPSVLLELGYLSNPDEERLLLQHAYRQRLADAVTRAINRWFTQASGNRNLSR